MLAYLDDQLYEGTQEQLRKLSSLLQLHWVVQLSAIEGDYFTRDGITWYPLTASPDQSIECGRFWYLVGDEDRPYGAFEAPEDTPWAVVVDLSEKTANLPIKQL